MKKSDGKTPKRVLRLPDLDFAKRPVLKYAGLASIEAGV
jgi:hypothetical protein